MRATRLPEWLIERGIGEIRYALIEDKEIVEARVLLDGVVPAGTALRAALKTAGRPAVAAVGENEFLLPDGAGAFTEGQVMTIEVTREAIAGAEPWKRPLAKVVDGQWRSAALPEGVEVAFPSPDDRLERAGWSDLIEEARSSTVQFDGGVLRVSATPAMILIDVDGTMPPFDLARAGAIGIDLPTLSGKSARKAVDDAIDQALPKPFERTAMNGFGFVQVVRQRRHASLFELAQDRAPFEARALLRRAAFEAPGPRTIVAHPAVIGVLDTHGEWMDALARQIGGAAGLRADASLAISAGYAEAR